MDERRRDRERAAAQGDHGAAVEALRHRLRAGEVSEERLELLVFLGDEVAAAALGRAVVPWPTEVQQQRRRIEALSRWGADCLARAGAAIAAALPVPQDDPVRRVAEALDEWTLCPCADHAAGVGKARTAIVPDIFGDEASAVRPEVDCVGSVAQMCFRPVGDRRPDQSRRLLMARDLALATEDFRADGPDPVAAMLEELRPWVLGTGDPVRERVTRRQ